MTLTAHAALKSSTFLPTLGALSTGLLLMTMQTTSAQAAGQYYNCANANGRQAVVALSTSGAAQFNAKFPAAMPTQYCGQPANTQVNGIKYYSFSGVGQITSVLDPSDYVLAATGVPFLGESNDGLVSACSSRLGYVIRDDYRMNHLDSANQVLGLTAWGESEPKSIYRAQVNRLKNAGL